MSALCHIILSDMKTDISKLIAKSFEFILHSIYGF